MGQCRDIHYEDIALAVARLCVEACTLLPQTVRNLLDGACDAEPFPPARETLELICHNADVARERRMPICQDTGMAVVYAELGQDAHICGGLLEDGDLRKSVVRDPIRRGNTGDNTPAVLHVRLVAGDRLRLTVAPKGFGSENMSRLCMLTPAQGLEGVKDFVVETAQLAGANPCPPMMLGVGVGGNFERVAELARQFGVPVLAVCGGLSGPQRAVWELGVDGLMCLPNAPMTLDRSMAQAGPLLTDAAERMARLLQVGGRLSQ